MEVLKLSDMSKGWFVGDFEPTAFKTNLFEASYKFHPKGEKWDKHFHKVATEINLLVSGHMNICDKEINAGDIFIIEPNEVADPIFYEDCYIVCIKTPSVIGDKYVIND